MFGLIGFVSIIYVGWNLIKEALEKPAPKGSRFDREAYWKDVENGMTIQEQNEKQKRGGYMTTKPREPEWYELPYDTIVDVERYNHDAEKFGKDTAESWRKKGFYRIKREIW